MWKALALKELRELAPIAGLGLLGYAAIVGYGTGYRLPLLGERPAQEPFVADHFVPYLSMVAVALALALGLRQSAAETLAGTWHWLLHRPLARTRIIGVKLVVGGAVYLLCTAVPILWYAAWAATPGTHPSPFYWSMTLDAWRVWLTVAAAYVAAFLCGIWPGRWFGSRLLVVTGAGITLFVSAIASASWNVTAWIVPVLLIAALASSILFVARTRGFS